MSRIFWDTNIFIYLLEGAGERAQRARSLRLAMRQRGDQLFTSALALGELLVKPMAAGAVAECLFYERTIASAATVLGFDHGHARIFADIRRSGVIRGPDAVHLACAAAVGMDLFITGDARLQGRNIPGIQFIVDMDRAPL